MDLRTRARRRPWAFVLLAVLAAALAARAAAGFRVAAVLPFDAALLAVAGVFLLRLARRGAPGGEANLWVGVALLCGALRAALWATGAPVHLANRVALGVGLALASGILAYRRWRRTRRAS